MILNNYWMVLTTEYDFFDIALPISLDMNDIDIFKDLKPNTIDIIKMLISKILIFQFIYNVYIFFYIILMGQILLFFYPNFYHNVHYDILHILENLM
jgi:hypothetical protein